MPLKIVIIYGTFHLRVPATVPLRTSSTRPGLGLDARWSYAPVPKGTETRAVSDRDERTFGRGLERCVGGRVVMESLRVEGVRVCVRENV